MTAALVLLACVVLPAAATAALLLRRPDPGPQGAVATVSVAGGLCSWLLTAALLERTVGVTTASTIVAAVVLGTGSVAVLAVAARDSRERRASGAGALALWAGGAALLSLATWWPVGRVVLETSWAPVASTPWYYWGLAADVAAGGHLPSEVTEWGTSVEFLADYRLFNAGTAMLMVVGPDVPALQAVTVLAVVVLGSGAVMLSAALGAGRLASLVAAPVCVGTGIGVARLTAYRPESLGLGLALVVVASGVWWFRRGDRAPLAAAAVLTAVLGQVHGIALVATAVLLCAAAAAYRPEGLGTAVRRLLAAGLALGGAWLVLGLLVGGASGTGHTGALPDVGGIEDPTWEFMRAIKGLPSSVPPSSLSLTGSALTAIYRESRPLVVVMLVLAAGVLVATAAQPLRPRGAREEREHVRFARAVTGFLLLSLAGLAVVAAVFALGWDGYVPRRTGVQRLVMEATLLAAPAVAAAVTVLGALVSAPVGRGGPKAAGRAVVLVAMALVTVLGTVTTARTADAISRHRPDRQTVEEVSDLGLPEEAVVLANAYTEGFLRRVAGATGLLEGRAPYTFPELLDRANTLMRGAQDYFAAPRRNRAFLDEHDVDYVVVAERRSFALGTSNVFRGRTRRGVLDADPRLRRLLDTGDLVVYEVLDRPD